MSLSYWLGLAVWLAPAAIVAYIALDRVRREQRQEGGTTAGFKGWLLVLVATLWANVLQAATIAVQNFTSPNFSLAAQSFPLVAALSIATSVVSISIALAAAWLLTAGSRLFKKVFTIGVLWAAMAPAFVSGASLLILRWHYSFPVEARAFLVQIFDPQLRWAWIISVVPASLWLLYVYRSRRVALTCVS